MSQARVLDENIGANSDFDTAIALTDGLLLKLFWIATIF